jgi:hypothetical protein
MRKHDLKSTLLATAMAVVATLSAGAASAQMHAMVPNMVLSRDHLTAHKADLEAMITDLSKVQSAADAKNYEGYLGGQMGKYVHNQKALHHVAMAGHLERKAKGGASQAEQAVATETDKLSETHIPKLASEMERVEKLNPGLKKHFDVLRTLD